MPLWSRKPSRTIAKLVAATERELATVEPGDTRADVLRGQLAGITSNLPAPLRGEDGDTPDLYRAGFRAGKLFSYLVREQRAFEGRLLPAAGTYAAAARTAASFDDPVQELERTHTRACIYLSRKGHEISEEEELAMFGWLADELGVPMTYELRARFDRMRRVRRDRLRTRDLADLIAEAQRAIEQAEPGSRRAEASRGILAGLMHAGPAPLRETDTETSAVYRAGFLTGHLQARLVREVGGIDGQLMLASSSYASTFPKLTEQELLDEPTPENALKAHTSACLRVAKKTRLLSQEDELLLFRWLGEELGVAITPTLLASHEATRKRRLERHQAN